ncbi:hypothetical protein HGRIS_008746 [Hohenbuehelia grisea]|uniref:RRM domain-containing protein n=1 Tax=Hohenbuehelia grisea TaxID=104357 RepID=A0ABR3J951_9AGAR
MDDAWQSQDIAPSNTAISIPNDAGLVSNGNAMVTDDPSWNGNGSARSPSRGNDPPRRSRSRSPVRGDRERGERGDRGDRGENGRGRGGDEGGHNPGNNLHVSGLSHKVDTRDLEAAFAKIGRVQKASVMHDPHTRESRGFGFVTMESAEEAEAAIAALNATDLMGKVMNVEKARRGRARTPTPGRYYGPPKRLDGERPYDPRPYDSRYSRDYDDRRRGGRNDDYPPRRDYDRDRGYGRDDRDRGHGRDDRDRDRDRGYGRDYDRGGRGYDDRRY